MARQVVAHITAWSYSRYNDYEQCPAKAKYKHVDRLKEPGSEVMDHGSAVHELAANFITGKLKRLAPELIKVKSDMQRLNKAGARCEEDWAFDAQWERVDWFAPTAWLRIKVDAHYLEVTKKGALRNTTVCIIDHKTGKHHPEHALQRSLYALGAFIRYPDAVKVVARHLYIDHGEEDSNVYLAKQLPQLKADWLKRIAPMMNDTRFAPRPGNYCRWCHFRKDNGGPCQY